MSCNSSDFRYCPCCGGLLETRRRGDRDRLACRECQRVLYVNPAVGLAVVVRRGEAILWGRRGSGPYRGAVVDFAHLVGATGIIENALREGSLPRVDVGNDAEVANGLEPGGGHGVHSEINNLVCK